MKNKLSEKNKYFIPKERYLELKHYCRQYPDWKKALQSEDHYYFSSSSAIQPPSRKRYPPDSVVEKYVLRRAAYVEKMKLIEQAAIETDEELYSYILMGVTEGYSYDVMYASLQIPCSRDTYYDRYRRFFFILDKMKD